MPSKGALEKKLLSGRTRLSPVVFFTKPLSRRRVYVSLVVVPHITSQALLASMQLMQACLCVRSAVGLRPANALLTWVEVTEEAVQALPWARARVG